MPSLYYDPPEPDTREPRWKNRIVGHADIDPKTLVPHPKNYRIHPTNQQEVVEGSLDDIGWFDEVKVNINTGTVVDGHLRVQLALRRDEPTIPVAYVDLTEEEEDEMLALKDTTASMAGMDRGKYRGLINDMRSNSVAVKAMFDKILGDAQPPAVLNVNADSPGIASGASGDTKRGGGEGGEGGEGVEGEEDEEERQRQEYQVLLDSEVTVTIECTQRDLEEFQATLRAWGRRKTVTVSFISGRFEQAS